MIISWQKPANNPVITEGLKNMLVINENCQ